MDKSKRHRSVGQRLAKATTPAGKMIIALEWAETWKNEQEMFARRIREALERNETALARDNLKQLEATIQKRHDVLPRILQALADAVDKQFAD